MRATTRLSSKSTTRTLRFSNLRRRSESNVLIVRRLGGNFRILSFEIMSKSPFRTHAICKAVDGKPVFHMRDESPPKSESSELRTYWNETKNESAQGGTKGRKPLSKTYESPTATLENEDCLEFMKGISSGTVDLILTDPPYEVSRETNFRNGERKGTDADRFRVSMDFGEWDAGFSKLGETIGEAYRVLRKGGTLIC